MLVVMLGRVTNAGADTGADLGLAGGWMGQVAVKNALSCLTVRYQTSRAT